LSICWPRAGLPLHPRPFNTTAFQWPGSNLIFPDVHSGQTDLCIVAMKRGEWIPGGEPRLLDPNGNVSEGPYLRGDRIAATSRIPARKYTGSRCSRRRDGRPVPLSLQPGSEFAPSLSADGQSLSTLPGTWLEAAYGTETC
jgi:hypothetical protein